MLEYVLCSEPWIALPAHQNQLRKSSSVMGARKGKAKVALPIFSEFKHLKSKEGGFLTGIVYSIRKGYTFFFIPLGTKKDEHFVKRLN